MSGAASNEQPQHNKCFQFVASPPDAACGGAAETGVMLFIWFSYFIGLVVSAEVLMPLELLQEQKSR
ncbi:hypothetical protein [Endozoicomonas numazuensis]|uniref:Uncharacterized protein n=1 Tax=Endozoicomonas numazuensis TaxID=1137799 RepID=A0A081NGH1_9GAMM|nr:hypothetical protein [Endozoicomonas numazuensis]KEQ17544.1 hypothetical protein GZ78_17520 [Endozoicomonas numazuensis]